MSSLTLAYSPCPNDTFIFHAWTHGLLPEAPEVTVQLADIDQLNQLALRQEADVIKVSAHALGHLRPHYALLHSGGALGRGCGPLIVARKDSWLRPATSARRVAQLVDGLERARLAVPGNLTTAAILMRLLIGRNQEMRVLPYDEIMPAVVRGEVDAGAIIHEGRFTYGAYGLRSLIDLGEWWEETTGLPLPLGVIVVRRSLGRDQQAQVEAAIKASVNYAWSHPKASADYVRRHAQEMDSQVCRAHIDLYVNDFTNDYGKEGEEAIRRLLGMAETSGIVPRWEGGLFWDEELRANGKL